MHSSFVSAEIHWIAGFKFFFLKATAISPHFQISSVDTTHQFRLSGTAAQNWKANATFTFFAIDNEDSHCPLSHVSHTCWWKYFLLCCSPSLQLRLTPDQEPGHSLMSSYVHTANLSITKKQQFLQLLTIKPSHNMLVECSKKPSWTQASSHLTVTEQCPEETSQKGEGLCHSTDHIWEAQLPGFLSFLRQRFLQLMFLTFPECVSSDFYFLVVAGKTIMLQ